MHSTSSIIKTYLKTSNNKELDNLTVLHRDIKKAAEAAFFIHVRVRSDIKVFDH